MSRYIRYLENGEYKYAKVKDVGELDKLKTTDKRDVVSAINSLIDGGVVVSVEIDELRRLQEMADASMAHVIENIVELETVTESLTEKAKQLEGLVNLNVTAIAEKLDTERYKQDKQELTDRILEKVDVDKFNEDYDAITKELQEKVDRIEYDKTAGKVSQIEVDVKSNADSIAQRVTKTEYDDAVGLNKWLAKKYDIDLKSNSETPKFNHLSGLNHTEALDVDDTVTINPFSGSKFVSYYFTNVYMNNAKNITLDVTCSNGIGIYMNGAMIAERSTSKTTAFQVTLSLRKGWNVIEVILNEYSTSGYFSLGKKLSSQVDKMTAVIGVGDKNETRLAIAETIIKQHNDSILLKAEKTEVTNLGNRIDSTEASIELLNDTITSTVNRTEFNNYSKRLVDAESVIQQHADAISSKVSQKDFDTLNQDFKSVESEIEQLSDSIALKVEKTDFDSLGKRVANNEQSIKIANDAIALNATKLDLDEVKGRVSSTEAQLTIQNNKIEQTVTKTAFQDAKEELEAEITDAHSRITQTADAIQTKVESTTFQNELAKKEDNIYKSTTAPLNPSSNSIWLDTSKTPNILKRWNGTSWIKATPTSASEVGAYSTSQGQSLENRMTVAETSITQTKDEISLKANALDVYTKNQTDNKVGTKADKTALEDTNKNLTDLVTKVENVEAEISVQAGEINLRATKTEVSTVSTTASTAVSTANTAKSTAESASKVAGEAKSEASTAKSNASSAVTTANTASTNASNAVSTANTASTNASSAVTTANTANTNASNAVNTANSVKDNFNDMSSDLKITPVEKIQLSKDYSRIKSEYAYVIVNASTVGATSTNYTNAFTALNGTSPKVETDILANMNSTYTFGSTTLRDAFKTKLNTYYDELEKIRKDINEKVNSTANTAKSDASTAKSNASSAVSTANSANTKATNAETVAGEAKSTASTASTNASSAVNTANSANTKATNAETAATTASNNASSAVSTANTAKSTADSVKSSVSDMSSDLKITPVEKKQLLNDWNRMKSEFAQIIVNAATVGASSTNYANAFNSLDTITPMIEAEILKTMSSTYTFGSTTLRDTFKTKLNTYYNELEKVRKDINEKVNGTANTASTNASSAVSTANTAKSEASSAVSTANTASTNASSALSTANTAKSDASTAKTNASSAVTTASEAKTTATTASTNASSALNTANTAKTTADSKAKTFTSTPTIPYALGDIWRNSSTVYICTTARTSGSYTSSDWTKVGDVTSANTAADTAKVNGVASATVTTDVSTAKTNASSAVTTANNASSTASTASTNASSALTTANTAKSTADIANSNANTAKSDASTAKTTASTASNNASTALNTANSANTKIDNLEVGGRNLVVNSATFNNNRVFTNGGYVGTRQIIDDSEAKSGKQIIIECTTAGNGFYSDLFNRTDSRIGKTFTWSFWAKTKVAKKLTVVGSETGGTKSVDFTTEWKKYTHTWTMNNSGNMAFVFYGGWSVGDIIYIRDFMIQEGNKATNDWIPAVEDVNAEINTAKSDANTAKTNASSAVTTANNANSTASTASTNATSALNTANTAKSTAETAKSDASTAKTDASSAKSTASTASNNASTALNTANSANSKVDNLEIGGKNLARITHWTRTSTVTLSRSGYKLTLTKTAGTADGIYISASNLGIEPSKNYVLSFKMRKVSGTIENIGGHTDATFKGTSDFKVDGVKVSATYTSPYTSTVLNDGKWHTVSVRITTPSTITSADLLYIQANRGLTTECVVEYEDIMFEQSNIAGKWNPSPLDVDAEIGTVKSTANTASSNASTALNTANSANTKVDSLQIGGRNIIKGTAAPKSHAGQAKENQTAILYNFAMTNAELLGKQVTVSYKWSATGSGFAGTFYTQTTGGNFYMATSRITLSDSNKSGFFSQTINLATTTDKTYTSMGIRLDNVPATVTVKIEEMKVEIGNKYSTWTPAIEDVDAEITTAKNNASSAVTTANTANNNASTASTNASSALTTANTAKTTADTAKSDASSAKTTASTAVTTANTASGNASTALTTANTAKSTADSKAKTFTSTPTVPYYVGDIWRNSSTISVCTTTRSSGSYTASDWTKVGDVTANNTAADTSKVNGIASSTVTSDVSTAKTTANTAVSNASTAQNTANAVNTKVDNLKVGGRNLIPNSNFINNAEGWSKTATSVTVAQNDFRGKNALVIENTGASSNVWKGSQINLTNGELKKGVSYVLSGWYYVFSTPAADSALVFEIKGTRVSDGASQAFGSFAFSTAKQNEWVYFETVLRRDDSDFKNVYSYVWAQINGKFKVAMPQFEEGTKASNWTPAPEDAEKLADSKAKTFTNTPTVPYNIGDIWRNGSTISVCTTAKTSTGAYAASDWTKVGDVTSSNTAADTAKVNGIASSTVTSDVSTAKNNASTAQNTANTAGTNANLALGALHGGTLNKNPYFTEWTDASIPVGHGVSSNSGTTARVNSDYVGKGYAYQFTVVAGSQCYREAELIKNVPLYNYATVDVTFKLVSGDITGAGVLFRYNRGSAYSDHYIKLKELIPSPIIGKWYTVTKTFKQGDLTDFVGYQTYIMGGFSSIAGSASAITAKVIQFDSVISRPATEQEINAYELKNTTVPALTTRVSSAESTIKTSTEQIALRATKTEVTNQINNITLGGENLLLNSDYTLIMDKSSAYGDKNFQTAITGIKDGSYNYLIGKTYTLSFFVRAKGDYDIQNADDSNLKRFGMRGRVTWWNSDYSATKYTYPFDDMHSQHGKEGRVSSTATITAPSGYPNLGTFDILMQFTSRPKSTNNAEWMIRRPKLEFGNKASDWSLSSEDVADISVRLSNAEQIITNESIVSTVTQSNAFATLLEGKADSKGLENLATRAELEGEVKDLKTYTQNEISKIDLTPFVKTSQLTQTKNDITASFVNAGGVNMIKNSVGFSKFDFWRGYNSNRCKQIQNSELEAMGFGSAWYFPSFTHDTDGGTAIQQYVDVQAGVPYTLSCWIDKVSANEKGALHVQFRDEGNTTTLRQILLNGGDVTKGFQFYQTTYTPQKTGRITIRIYAYKECVATVTGLMLNKGSQAFEWTMAKGEVYNTNVQMDMNGIKVTAFDDGKESRVTVMTPDRFAGYYDVDGNGTINTSDGSVDEVFKMNDDRFVMKKAEVREEIDMGNIKIININTSSRKGWGFIPS